MIFTRTTLQCVVSQYTWFYSSFPLGWVYLHQSFVSRIYLMFLVAKLSSVSLILIHGCKISISELINMEMEIEIFRERVPVTFRKKRSSVAFQELPLTSWCTHTVLHCRPERLNSLFFFSLCVSCSRPVAFIFILSRFISKTWTVNTVLYMYSKPFPSVQYIYSNLCPLFYIRRVCTQIFFFITDLI